MSFDGEIQDVKSIIESIENDEYERDYILSKRKSENGNLYKMKKAGSALHYAKITVTESGGEERVFYKSGLIAYVDTALFVCLLILFFAFWIKAFIKFIKQIKNGEFENAQNLRRMKNMK